MRIFDEQYGSETIENVIEFGSAGGHKNRIQSGRVQANEKLNIPWTRRKKIHDYTPVPYLQFDKNGHALHSSENPERQNAIQNISVSLLRWHLPKPQGLFHHSILSYR